MSTVIILAAAAAAIFAALKLFRSPLKLAMKLAINTLLGFAALWLFDFLFSFTGFRLGLNWVNAAVLGVLGAPGFALVVVLNWLCTV